MPEAPELLELDPPELLGRLAVLDEEVCEEPELLDDPELLELDPEFDGFLVAACEPPLDGEACWFE